MYEKVTNLNQALLAAMDAFSAQTCLQVKQGRNYQGISYQQFQMLTFRLARFFVHQGIGDGERIVIAADNSATWLAAFLAGLFSGGVVVPVHTTTASDTLQFILEDTGACLALLQQTEHIEAISSLWDSDNETNLPDLQTILTTNHREPSSPPVISIDTVLAEPLPTPEQITSIRAYAQSITPQAIATIQYVTGEMGQLKGAIFEQAQLLASMRSISQWFILKDDELGFTTRPWSELPSLLVSLHYLLSGVGNVLSENEETIGENMQQTSPTVMLSVPYSSELFYEDYMARLAQQPTATQEILRWALAKGKEYHSAREPATPELHREYGEADMTFFNQIRGEMGGRMRRTYSTSASLAQEVADFYRAIGLPLLNVYSLVEAGGFPAINSPGNFRAGSCGQTAPGYQIRLAGDGEILIKGDMVMRSYWQRPAETGQAFDEDGWLRSGDIGRIDEQGYLHITDRKRHVIVTSKGRKVAPAAIEKMLTASPYIAQAALIGEGKPYLSAMIAPDLETLAAHFEDMTDDEGKPINTTAHPKVKELLEDVISQVNSQLDQLEQIREFSLLEQLLTQEAGELTASMKLSRHVIARRHAATIEAMYPETHQLETKEVFEVHIEPERLRELLEKESILDAWLADAGIEFLFRLARQKQIDAPSMVHICDTAAMIAQMENEERPLSTALIVGDPVRIGRILPPSQIQLLSSDHIRRMRNNLVTLAKMVDGLVLGYVVDKHGYVRGIHKLRVDLESPGSFLLGPQFRHHAAISQHCQAMVFFVPAGGRQVRVFADGELVGRYSNGDWSPESMPRVDEMIRQLAVEKQYDLDLVRRVLRCAFQMSEENLGAIFIIGNASAVFEHSDASEISHFALMLSAPMDELTDEELINFAQQDGATVIDIEGQFRGCMVLLRPDAETQAEIGPGKGARHSSAAKMSAEAHCLAITVSHDGPITVYNNGKRVLSL